MTAKLPQGQADRLLRIAFHADPDGNHPTTGLLRDMQDCSGIEAAIAAAYELGQQAMRHRASDYLRGQAIVEVDRQAFESAYTSVALRKAAADFANNTLWEES